jgi:hypothetical protein
MDSKTIPFSRDRELYHKLSISSNGLAIRRNPLPASAKNTLPGQPRIELQDHEIGTFLRKELMTPDLNKFSPHLWKVAKQDSSHVASLTHQIVRGRQIIITENPELHLVWIYDRVYVKPIPKYLLSHAFWEFFLVSKASPLPDHDKHEIAKAARGFLRSYSYLVRHKSDLSLAQDDKHALLPKSIHHSEFIRFITEFEHVQDAEVSSRYSFGELRLTRLNFWAIFVLGRLTFHKTVWQYGAYFARFYGPILFIFGIFSVTLSAMQVALAVQPTIQLDQSWIVFFHVSRGFSIFTLLSVALIVFSLVSALLVLSLREILFAVKDLYNKRRYSSQSYK